MGDRLKVNQLHLDGVLGNGQSTVDESFSSGLLEYSQYTHPRIFEDVEVPEVLTSGNHKKPFSFCRCAVICRY